MNDRTIQPGDHVHWTHISQRGRTISMARREGVIEGIDGGLAIVRSGKNRRVQVAVARLCLDDQPSQIDEFVDAMREASRL